MNAKCYEVLAKLKYDDSLVLHKMTHFDGHRIFPSKYFVTTEKALQLFKEIMAGDWGGYYYGDVNPKIPLEYISVAWTAKKAWKKAAS
jgi:hypothetical protein